MTLRAYRLLGVLVIMVWLLLDAQKAHAQTATCMLDANQFLTALFGMPSQELLTQAFNFGLVTVLAGYIFSYLLGLLVSFFND